MASALGLQVDPAVPATDAVVAHLKDQRVLLILDNCEHVIDTVASIVDAILRSAPDVTVLATSREPLRIRGEVLVELDPLVGSDAERLFIDRAVLADRSFAASADDAATIAEICTRLDGIPLALELAASQLRTMTLVQLAESLDDRFSTLTSGYRTDLPRQQTLRATIDWSHDLLSEPERVLFRRLSAFRGGATLDAIERVCGEGIDVSRVLSSLIDRSLVVPGDERFTMLETIREYARERLDASDEADVIGDLHRQHYGQFVIDARQDTTQAEWLSAVEPELDNIRAALGFRQDEKMVKLVDLIDAFWLRRGPIAEGIRWYLLALDVDTAPSEGRSSRLTGLATLQMSVGQFDEAQTTIDEAMTWFRERGEPGQVARCLQLRSELAIFRGEFDAARSDLDEALSLDVGDDPDLFARCHHSAGHLALSQGRYDDAADHARASRAAFLATGEEILAATAQTMIGRIALIRGEAQDAVADLTEALETHRGGPDEGMVAISAWSLAMAELELGMYAEAIDHLNEAIVRAERIGDANTPLMEATLATAECKASSGRDGWERIDRVIADAQTNPYVVIAPYAYSLRAEMHLTAEQPTAALPNALRGAWMFRDLGSQPDAAGALLTAARAVGQLGDPVLALTTIAALTEQRIRDGGADMREHPDLAKVLDGLRADLGDARYDELWAEGAPLSLDEAIALFGSHEESV
jgi:predicted ATPase